MLSAAFFSAAACTLLFAFEVEGSATIVVVVSCLFNACTTAAWNVVRVPLLMWFASGSLLTKAGHGSLLRNQFGVLSAESFPLEVRTTGIAIVNCSGRIGAICAQFVNGFLVGPPPHIEALLLVVTSVMVVGGVASHHVQSVGGGDDASHPRSPLGGRTKGHTRLAADDDDDTNGVEMTSTRVGEEGLDDHEADDDGATDASSDPEEETRRCLRKGDRS